MGPEQQIAAAADGVAQGPHEALGAIERLQRQLPRIEGRIGADRVELDRREPLLDVFARPLCRQIRIPVDVGPVAVLRVQVGVGPQPLVDAAAEQLVDRLAQLLADDVPAGHLDAAENAHERGIGALGVAAGVDDPPQPLDLERIGAHDMARADILDHARDDVGMKRNAVDLADTRNAAIGHQLEKDEIAPAEMRRRVADHESLHVDDLHGQPSGERHDRSGEAIDVGIGHLARRGPAHVLGFRARASRPRDRPRRTP